MSIRLWYFLLVVIFALFILIYTTSVDLKLTTTLSLKNSKWDVSGVKVIVQDFMDWEGSAFNDYNYDLQWNITWRIYGVNSSSLLNEVLIPDSLKKAVNPSKANTEIFKKDLPLKLQQQLMQASPLSCYSGDQGLFPKKYEKLLIALAGYSEMHRIMSETPNNARTLIWRCHASDYCGGLADRVRGMTFSLLLAMFSQRRLILDCGSAIEWVHFEPNVINWKDDELLQTILHLKSTNTSTTSVIEMTIHSIGKVPFLYVVIPKHGKWEHQLNAIAGNTTFVVMVTNVEVLALRSILNQNWLVEGLKKIGLLNLTNHEMNDIIGIVFRYLFQWEDELVSQLSLATKVLKLTNQPYVGVHIRTGFYGDKSVEEYKHRKLIRDKDIWNRTLKCAVATADKFLGNSSIIFLATDSNIVKEMAVVTYGMRFRSLNNTLIHVGTWDKKITKPHRREQEGALFTLVDLFLLAQSYVLLRGDSGYSWMAGELCGIPKEHLINGTSCDLYDVSM